MTPGCPGAVCLDGCRASVGRVKSTLGQSDPPRPPVVDPGNEVVARYERCVVDERVRRVGGWGGGGGG